MHTTPDRIFYFEKVKLLNFGVNFFFEITKLSILTKVKISDCYGFQTFFLCNMIGQFKRCCLLFI